MRKNSRNRVGVAALVVLGLVNSYAACGGSERTDAVGSVSGHIATTVGAGGEGGRGGMENSGGMGGVAQGGNGGTGQASSSSTGGSGGVGGAGGQGGTAGMGGAAGQGGFAGMGGMGQGGGVGGSGGMGGNGCLCQGPGILEFSHVPEPNEQFQITYMDWDYDPNTTLACGTMGLEPCQKIVTINTVSPGIEQDIQVDFIPEGEAVPNPACTLQGVSLYDQFPSDPPYLYRVQKAFQLAQNPLSVSGFEAYPPPHLTYADSPKMQIQVADSCPQPHGAFVPFP